MVKALHRAGIEVYLDVVYNHTCEGNHLGPTLCYRGIDNASYYWLMPDNPRLYENSTGCGNALKLGTACALFVLGLAPFAAGAAIRAARS